MKKLALILSAGLLLGVGCTTSPVVTNVNTDAVNDCATTTTWGSCINDQQADSALLGTWTLTEQQIVAATGTVSNPFNGRTLTFTEDAGFNGYVEDWSPEIVNKTVDTPSAGSVTSECDTAGTLTGAWAAVSGVDAMELWIVPAGEDLEVTCQADGIAVTSTAASTPLGVGVTTNGPNGPYVRYNYALSEDLQLLTINQYNDLAGTSGGAGVYNVFFFER